MEKIITGAMCVIALADDLHYGSSGVGFYSDHLLADRVKDGIDKAIDALKEAYYMGEMKTVPPLTSDLMVRAAGETDEVRAKLDGTSAATANEVFLMRLNYAADTLVHRIEDVKKTNQLCSGTVAILDGISQSMLVAVALTERRLAARLK